jgi:hypothetical protein
MQPDREFATSLPIKTDNLTFPNFDLYRKSTLLHKHLFLIIPLTRILNYNLIVT